MTAYHIQPSPSRLTTLSDGTTQGRADAPCIQRANERSRSIQSSCRSGHDGSCRELGLVAIDGVLELGLEAAEHVAAATALCPIAFRRSGCWPSVPTASTKPALSAGATSRPLRPFSTCSPAAAV